MTAIATHGRAVPVAGSEYSLRSSRATLAAARKYAELGWRVLPGPVCDGLANWHPISEEPPSSNEPTVPSSSATTDQRVIDGLWKTHQQTILAPVGDSFGVLRVSTPLACQAAAIMERGNLWPVALAPNGGHFFVEAGATLPVDLRNVRDVGLAPRGSLVALPCQRPVRIPQVRPVVAASYGPRSRPDARIVTNAAVQLRSLRWNGSRATPRAAPTQSPRRGR